MEDYSGISRSFERCLRRGDVVQRFYDLFMASHPDIPARFTHTNFGAQKRLLEQGVNLAILYADGNPVGQIGVDRIRNSHARSRMNIPPHFYDYWQDAFLTAIAEFDGEFSDTLRAQWERVLQKTIAHVRGGYEE